ncbi:MAG: DoxX family membrane protein [Isosphaeraceae bacterium]
MAADRLSIQDAPAVLLNGSSQALAKPGEGIGKNSVTDFFEGTLYKGKAGHHHGLEGSEPMDTTKMGGLSTIYYPLRLVYGLVPIVAGLDKFFNVLTDWGRYLPSAVADVLPISTPAFMMVVGVIEIIVGLAVLTKFTQWGAYVVMAWLTLIALNLVAAGLLDIAVRDLVMAVGAYTLGQVAVLRKGSWAPVMVQTN